MPILRSIAERFGRSASRRDDAAELRRDPGRHADADRHLDQPSGLGRARQARRAAARLLRLHAARPGAGALPAAPTSCSCRSLLPQRDDAADLVARGRQAVHRRARRRAGFAADRRERPGRHVPEPGRGHGAPRPARRARSPAAVRGRHPAGRRHPDRRRDPQGADRDAGQVSRPPAQPARPASAGRSRAASAR